MALMDDLTRDDESNNTGSSPIRRLTGLAQAPASAAPSLAMQTRGDARPSPAQRLTGGPLARAASMAPAPSNPMDDGSLSAGISASAGQERMPRIAQLSALDSQKDMIPSNANPNPVQMTPRQIADAQAVDRFAPAPEGAIASLITARTPSGPTNVPVNRPAIAERSPNLVEAQNQAYREGDPIGRLIQQKLGQQASAPQDLALASGIIGGGDTTYSPGMAARTDPFKTADGRTLDPNDPNLATADRSAISQYKAGNAQMAADMERQQRSNPLAGAVQIIRPGNDVSYAVQGADRMVELQAPAFAQYQSAFEKNPQLGSRSQMTEAGMTLDGLLAPPDLIAGGEGAVKRYAQATQQNTLNAADPLAAKTAAEIEVERVKNQGKDSAARIGADAQVEAARIGREATKATKDAESLDRKVNHFSDQLAKTNVPVFDSLLGNIEAQIAKYQKGDIPGYGGTGMLPQFMLTEEGKKLRQDVGMLKNITLKDRSGQAVTNQEMQRFLEELGTGYFSNDDQLRNGLSNVRRNFNATKQNVVAGVDDATLTEYMNRGGMTLQRGNQSATPAKPGTDKGDSSAGGQEPPPTKVVDYNGGKTEAKRAPDGNYYVKQANGKYTRVDE